MCKCILMNDFMDRAKKEAERVSERASEARDAVVEKAEQAREKIAEAANDAHAYVKENPVKSAGIALGIGAVIGSIAGFFTGRKK